MFVSFQSWSLQVAIDELPSQNSGTDVAQNQHGVRKKSANWTRRKEIRYPLARRKYRTERVRRSLRDLIIPDDRNEKVMMNTERSKMTEVAQHRIFSGGGFDQ